MISLYNNKIVLAYIAIIAHVYVCTQAVAQNSSKRKHSIRMHASLFFVFLTLGAVTLAISPLGKLNGS